MRTYLIIVVLLLIGLLSNCAVQDTGVVVSGGESIPASKGLEAESYRIRPGDQLEIKFYYNRKNIRQKREFVKISFIIIL